MSARTDRAKPHHPLAKPPLPKAWRKGRAPAPPPDPQREELRQAAGIADHLARVNKLLKKHELTRRGQRELYALLDQIEEHEREQRLFLGVVGEFSSGKSTLLNALLRDDLLLTDIRQGTTSAATVIGYGPELAVAVRRPPAHPVVRLLRAVWLVLAFPIVLVALIRAGRKRDRNQLREMIREHSAVEEVARRVAQVNVSHPAECLRNGMVIVDLPGTNAENPRHGRVTAAAMAEFCDAALVVLPSVAAGSETLWGFLRDHTEPDVLRRCVFVLNKIDLIRPRERDKLVESLTARLRRDLGIDRPRVVAAAPERVLEAEGIIPAADEPEFAPTAAEKAAWVAAFGQTEAVLWAALREQKLLLQVERLTRLLARIFEILTAILTARDTDYREQHAALERGIAQIPDLKQFVTQARDKHCGAFRPAVAPAARECSRRLARVQEAAMRTLSQTVFGTKNRKELQQALEGGVARAIAATQRELRDELRAAVGTLEHAAEEEHRRFHVHFQKLYRNLATLGGRVRTESAGLEAKAAGAFTAGTAAGSLAGEIAQLRTENLMKAAGGAGVGALVGTLVLPGVGTVIGGVLGGLFGRLFGPSLAELQQRCWAQLEPAVRRGFAEFDDKAVAALDRAAEEIEDRLADVIVRYAEQYRRLLADVIARDTAAAAALAEFRAGIERDLAGIAARQEHLAQARARLRAL